MEAKFVAPANTVDYTPSADVAAGDIVVQGALIGVAVADIPANTLGAIAVEGTFDIVKDENAISAGAAVFWDAVAGNATATTKTAALGVAVEAAADTASTVRVKLLTIAELDVTAALTKATEAEIKTGTDDAKYVTAKGLADGANEDTGYVKVDQAALIADITDAASGAQIATAVNAIIAVLKTHGLIASA